MNTPDIDRRRGCLLGLACGDAIGTTVEFSPPGSFEPLTDLSGGGPFRLQPGQWTDDTSLALCLAASLIERRAFDPDDQMQRYLRWFRDGYLSSTGACFDIGITTRRALLAYEKDGEAYAGSSDPRTAGNGSLMRLAPVAIFYRSQPEKAIERCGDSSRTTHAALEAVDACRYFGGLLVGALRGDPKDRLLSNLYAPAQGYWQAHMLAPSVAEVAEGSYKRKNPPEIIGSSYVVRSLEAALWAFYHSQNFEHGCLLAVNLGDDADTTGAIYGQIAGAYYGESGIPDRWLTRLASAGMIGEFAERL